MKTFKTIFAVFLLTVVISCEDATDGVQPGEFSPEAAFQNLADLEQGIFGVYSGLSITNLVNFTSIFTDEVSIGASNGGQGLTNDALHTYNLNSNNGTVAGLWSGNYALIFRANTLLEAASKITPANTEEEDRYNRIIAEATALRAFGHAQLLSVFAENLTDDNSLGVILIDFVPNFSTALPRSTVGESMSFINNDLNEAETLLTGLTNPRRNLSRIFIDVDFVRALRARMALYTEDFTTAEQMANAVIANHSIASRADFPNVWTDQSTSGVIFRADRTDATDNDGTTLASIWNTNSTNRSGAQIYEVSRSVYNILAANPNDVRTTTYVDPSSLIDPNYDSSSSPEETDILVIDKYPGDPSLNSLLINDQKIFRSAEMHLIKAESRIFNSDLSGAAQEIKNIRDNRYSFPQALPNYANATEAWADVLLERRLELYLEGHRYIDFNRLANKSNVLAYDRDQTDCKLAALQVCDLPRNDTRTQSLPIPQDEFAGNPGISGQQNPGY